MGAIASAALAAAMEATAELAQIAQEQYTDKKAVSVEFNFKARE